MFCTNCGNATSDGANFCGHCGKPLNSMTQPTLSPAAAPGYKVTRDAPSVDQPVRGLAAVPGYTVTRDAPSVDQPLRGLAAAPGSTASEITTEKKQSAYGWIF